ncbi:threonine synthase [Chryseosolibacter indicus]|uniref:Threonine synthase n=1 Tax=Chryseosolibacter indicus TaxID=2782351 RepID=A0ABS5VYQ1_9BACT|nr:threonine synthase [Chryseosolibacter indicus]MBT1705980.1 threonine synthase [Chryseosolibacter indicus]
MSRISFLQCSVCDKTYPIEKINTYATCDRCEKSPLICEYTLLSGLAKCNIDQNERSMWRYFEMLPVLDKKNIVSLGEGWTPLLSLPRLGSWMGVHKLLLKDESLNPTGSFKARGLSMAISKAKELGITECITPTAGNAGGAMAAYCASAGMRATVVMPRHTPQAFKTECQYFGATLIEVEGLISDCAKKVAELNVEGRFFDVSTMREPYRLEGKKTMGYEIAEQLGWRLPDVILYPTGGGTGLIGLWKAFSEMIELGWIENKMPRLVAVQTENCRPVVNNFFDVDNAPEAKASIANGLSVPFPFARKLIQRVLNETNGTAIAIEEDEIIPAVKEIASKEGLFVSPEGATLVPALKKLLASDQVHPEEEILLLNTGTGYKYIESF